MDDYISRKAALKAIYTSTAPALEVKAMPAAAVVEVVRCADCQYSDIISDRTEDTFPLKCLGIRYGGVYPYWFCEHGKRKGGQDNV